jgi:hypothetical protein
MEDCTHRKFKMSTWVGIPPFIGRLRTCWQCGAVKAGRNSVTLAGNYIDMTHASAPSDPSSANVRVYADTASGLKMRNSSSTETDLSAGGTLSFVGSDTSAATTTNTSSDQDLGVVDSISIAATTPFYIFASMTVTKDNNGGGYLGLKLNSTQVIDGHGESKMSNHGSDVDTSGAICIYVPVRQTNYLRAVGGFMHTGDSTANGFSGIYEYTGGADMPTVTITSVTLTGMASTSGITVGIDEMFVYAVAN